MTKDEAIRKAVNEWYDAEMFIILAGRNEQTEAIQRLDAEVGEVCAVLEIDEPSSG